MVGVCALVKKGAGGECEDVRVGLTHMGPTPLRASAVEDALRGGGLDAQSIAGAAAQAGGGHRTAGRPQRDARLQASPGHGAYPAGARGGRGALSFDSPAAVNEALASESYLADRGLCVAVYLAASLEQPLLLEGEAGVGKTEVAKALAGATGSRLIRLQCHEGIDLHHALYDWDYPRQLLHLRAAGSAGVDAEGSLYSERFLLRRPLLDALQASEPVVLLIDEVDRADDEFEAFLLEFLSDFQVSIPELGTVSATRRPLVVVTSNRTRELHDALKRRCLYHWIDYPAPEREAAIVRARLPGVPEELAAPRLPRRGEAARGGALQAAGRGRDDRPGTGATRARFRRNLRRPSALY